MYLHESKNLYKTGITLFSYLMPFTDYHVKKIITRGILYLTKNNQIVLFRKCFFMKFQTIEVTKIFHEKM